MKNLNYVLAIMLMFTGIVLGAEELKTGEVIKQVSCASDKNQTYAVYLPKNYKSSKKSPILYCFDPEAKGDVPVELFKTVAEKYGFIVLGSNNVKNGPWAPILKAVKAIWEDSHKRFSIDNKRIYAVGFSGGGQVATALPFLYPGKVAGVIACAGAFSKQHKPHKDMKWRFYALVGNKDPNIRHIQQLSILFNQLRIPHRAKVFNGAHVWPPEPACAEAVEWMNLEAMKTGNFSKDEKMLKKLLASRMADAGKLEQSQKPILAFSKYQEIKQDFNGLPVDSSQLEAAIQRMFADPTVQKAMAQSQKNQAIQKQAQQEFGQLVNKLRGSKNRDKDVKAYLAAAKSEVDPNIKLRKQMVLNFLLKNCFTSGNKSLQENKLDLAVINLKITTQLKPDLYAAWYNLACAYSRQDKKEMAVKTLKKAVETGFKDLNHIKKDKDFNNIRKEPGFLKLIGQ